MSMKNSNDSINKNHQPIVYFITAVSIAEVTGAGITQTKLKTGYKCKTKK